MQATQPPKLLIARWLLHQFGCSPNNDAVIGDLDERYRQDRSRMWYWSQVLTAIVISFVQEVSAHKLLAMRALIAGWLVKTVWLGLLASSVFGLATAPPKYSVRLVPLLIASAMSIAVCAMSAWLVSRVSGPHYQAMVLLYLAIELLTVPIIINLRISVPFPAVIVGYYGPIAFLWPQPFATYLNLALMNLGYPLSPVAALWCGSILTAVTTLIAGRVVRNPTALPDGSIAKRA